MPYSRLHKLIVVVGLAAAMLALPSQGKACLFRWLCPSPSCPPGTAATTYAPPYTTQRISYAPLVAAAPTAGACVSQTCSYVPETRYRWKYSRMPVTTHRPVSSCDPCSGRLTTVYQPVTRTTFFPWLHREPYTAYRLVCSSAAAPVSTTAYAPCSPVVYTPGVVDSLSCPAGCVPITSAPGITATAPGADPGYAPPATFKKEPAAGSTNGSQQPRLQLRPTPDPNTGPASLKKPTLIPPDHRTTAKPIRFATYRHPVRRLPTTTDASSNPGLDVGGWRASRD